MGHEHTGFGKWSMNKSTFDLIRKLLPEGKTILELGSGWGTSELSKHYKMYSIEADFSWLDKYNSTYIYAPVKKYDAEYIAPPIPNNTAWHDPEVLKEELPKIKYDLIFIDGPWGNYGRGGFYKHIDLFNTNVPLIFDDINREPEKILMEKVSEYLKRPYHLLGDNVTGYILPE